MMVKTLYTQMIPLRSLFKKTFESVHGHVIFCLFSLSLRVLTHYNTLVLMLSCNSIGVARNVRKDLSRVKFFGRILGFFFQQNNRFIKEIIEDKNVFQEKMINFFKVQDL